MIELYHSTNTAFNEFDIESTVCVVFTDSLARAKQLSMQISIYEGQPTVLLADIDVSTLDLEPLNEDDILKTGSEDLKEHVISKGLDGVIVHIPGDNCNDYHLVNVSKVGLAEVSDVYY